MADAVEQGAAEVSVVEGRAVASLAGFGKIFYFILIDES